MTASPLLPHRCTRPGALAGIKVLDLSRVLAGPWATQMLADLGADVVKVERPVAGDDTRHWGPPFLKDDAGNDTREASYFTACNRNKRSITVDMAHPEGQALLRAWRRGRCGGGELQDRRPAQYGLDYESLKALNPRLVYCSITGFGQDGPYAERAGYDLMVQAMCGLMSITGHADGEPGGGPLKVGVAVIDVFTGLYASNAILAALNARDNAPGRGGPVHRHGAAGRGHGRAGQPGRRLSGHRQGAGPRRQHPPQPGALPGLPDAGRQCAAGHWQRRPVRRFCAAIGHAGWAQDARFATNTARVQNRAALLS
jgi:crotonobetainyl-CoA:carnitine CoA-transferase CaiB-like acyl-CoA transferase